MKSNSQRKHTHKRCSSLIEEPTQNIKPQRVTLPNEISSEQTLKLLQESQNKTQFQVIVDSLEAEQPFSPPSQGQLSQPFILNKQLPPGGLFSEYFQIEEVQSLKRTQITKENLTLEQQPLQKLGREPKINSRLRYHMNIQLKAFKDANSKLAFPKNWNKLGISELSSKPTAFIKA